MNNPIITVVRDPQHTLGKHFTLSPDGTVSKKSSVNVSFGIAVMHRVETHEELAALLAEVGNDPHAAIINASFDGIEVGEEFIILSQREIANRIGIPMGDRQKQKGIHQITYKGKIYKAVGRLKENVSPSSWQIIDRDVDQHTPAQFAELPCSQLLAALSVIWPPIANSTYVKTASSSSRIMLNGQPIGGGNGHVWVKIENPDDLDRFRTAMVVRAAEAGITWLKPRYSRKEPGKVVGQSLATIFDPSVWTAGRVIFVGQPVVGDGLTVLPPSPLIHRGETDVLDSATVTLPDAQKIREITRTAGVEMDLQSGSTGLHITARDLTIDTEIETESGETLTVRELHMRGNVGKVRCQTPFLESNSFAAFYCAGAGGKPFIYDVGTGVTHRLKEEDANVLTVQTALATIQQQFSLIYIDGRAWVLEQNSLAARTSQGSAQKLVLSNRNDGTLRLQRALTAQFPQVNASRTVGAFFVSPQTICYDGVDFDPAGTTGNRLNLWIGPTIIPKAGSWLRIKSFLLEVICVGDNKCYSFLIGYVAHALQRPWEKPGILIILLGGQGTGKGTLGRILRAIWGATYLQVHNIDAVTGNFNAALERAFIVFMDEALFAGDRRASDALKSLVTEPIIHINEKYQPARQTQSFHRFFAATNADHLKNTERDDRRDFVLRVSEKYKGDHEYWQALQHEIINGGVEAMAHDLLAMDLSEFNVRSKPDTQALLEQKLQSLTPIARWWYDCLERGECFPDGDWPTFISTDAAVASIVELAGGRIYRKPAAIEVVQALMKLCPSAAKRQQQTGLLRQRGITLPSLERARAEFEQYIGGTVNWTPDQDSGAGK